MLSSNGRTAILKYHSAKKSMKAPRIIAERFIQQSFPAIRFVFTVQKYEKNTEMTYDCRMPYFYLVKILVYSRIEIMLPFLRRACAHISCKGFGTRPKRSLIPAQAIFETPGSLLRCRAGNPLTVHVSTFIEATQGLWRNAICRFRGIRISAIVPLCGFD